MFDNVSNMEIVHNMTIFYPREATILAAVCACIFSVVGVVALENWNQAGPSTETPLFPPSHGISVPRLVDSEAPQNPQETGNFITTMALLMHPKLRGHVTTMFVLSLCVSDLLFCSINLPLTATRYIQQHWSLGPRLCQMFAFVFYGNEAVSLLSMVAITINRYTLIAYYDMYSQIYTTTKIWVQLLLIWIVSFGFMVPPLLGVWGQLGLDENTFSCTILKKDGHSPKKYLFVFGFVLPCVVIIVSYSCIYWKVRESKKKLEGRSKLSGQTAKEKEEDSRLTTLMLTIFLCFLACFLPLMIMNVADDEITYPWLHVIASILAWASSVINPLIYAATNRQYRAAYANLLKLCKNNPVTRRTTWGSRTVGQSSNSPHYPEKRSPKDKPTNL